MCWQRNFLSSSGFSFDEFAWTSRIFRLGFGIFQVGAVWVEFGFGLNSTLEEHRNLFVHKLGSGGWPHRWVLSLVAEALQSVGVLEFVAWNLTYWGLKISSAGMDGT